MRYLHKLGGAKSFLASVILFVPVAFLVISRQHHRISSMPPMANGHNMVKQGVLFSGQRVRSVDWESLISNGPPLSDWRTAPTPDRSVLRFAVKQDTYRVGDEVIVNITVRDFLGRRKTRGGDIVRVVARDAHHQAASIGYVLDNHDGTYTGVIKMLWAGRVTIETRVGSTREMIQTMHRLVESGYNKRRIFGQLDHEVVRCTPVLVIAKRYRAFCNYTHINADLPWFCEPSKNGSCDAKSISHFFANTYPLNITEQERIMYDKINSRRVPNFLTVRVNNDSNGAAVAWSQLGRVPCNQFPPRDLWKLNSPIGSVYNNVWHPLHCRMSFNETPRNFEKCLRGRTIWFIGDSNARQMFNYLFIAMEMHLLTEDWAQPKWNVLSVAENAKKSVTAMFAFHAMPCYIPPPGKINGTHDYLDRIPAGSSDIFIMHFYMHYMGFPPDVFRQTIQKTVKAVKALRVRAPNVKVVVRGCHSMYVVEQKTQFDDYWAIVFDRILKEEFRDVSDWVIFMDTWDVSEALDNRLRHPNMNILNKIIIYLMTLICA